MKDKCISCEVSLEDIIKEYGKDAVEDGYQLEVGFLCYPCAEYDLSEAPLTVYHKKDEYPKKIGNYISDYWLEGEESPFSMEWVPTDAWRGHYETKAGDSIAKIFSDSILSYHESEQMLKVLHDIAIKAFDLTDIDYYRVFSRTSNVFCTNLDFYVEKAKEELGKEIIDVTKKFVNYDDPVFSTGILFPRDQPEDFELGNINSVKNTQASDAVKQMVIVIGQEILTE
jgi:hypothetical protein